MPATIIIGAQWGDEGKGRVVDYLATQADIVARFSGGDNAGHTIYLDGQVFKLHLIPSGILHPQSVCVLGNGMVINPVNLVKEIDYLRELGVEVTPERLLISSKAHLITPAHVAQDAAQEAARGDQKLGTTLRGIGPAYLDKIGRRGLRAGQMEDVETFADAVEEGMRAMQDELARTGLADAISMKSSVQEYVDAAERLRPFIADTTVYLHQQLKQEARVLCEGAQGTLLDIDHGSYPFVTSSSPSVGGALTGLGFGPKFVDRVVGVTKAFSTRVGSGAMPTELHGELGDRLRGTGSNFWDEFGTTTGRPRRCGWLDVVMLRYAAAVNGFTELVVTKLDILSGFEELKLAVAYEIDGEETLYPPMEAVTLERAKPVYETLPGWDEPVGHLQSLDELPQNAQRYIARIAELCEVPIQSVSVGPERDQLISF